MRILGSSLAITAVFVSALVAWPWAAPAHGQEAKPLHVRGQLTRVEDFAIVIKTKAGRTVRLQLADNLTVISLSKGSFTEVTFGTYVGAAAVKLDAYSPIVRDSLSWLHRGFELHIVDEELRGIAAGHKPWDLTSNSIIAHGWVDDMEGRVLSIKYGPTEEEETDVEVPRDVPVLKMSVAKRDLLKTGMHILAGTHKGEDGKEIADFLLIGMDGIVPPL